MTKAPSRKMFKRLVAFVMLAMAAVEARPQATVLGKVELPKTTKAPVMAKRYEIVSQGGALAPNPPVAIVYLEGRFPLATNAPTQQIVQTNYTFVPALL